MQLMENLVLNRSRGGSLPYPHSHQSVQALPVGPSLCPAAANRRLFQKLPAPIARNAFYLFLVNLLTANLYTFFLVPTLFSH